MIEIPLTRGKVALIDDCDAHLATHRWYAHRTRSAPRWYAARHAPREGGGRRTLLLHREILGITDPAIEGDHIDGNGLDCRRHNLREATNQQNQANRGVPANNTSGYKGVHWHRARQKWQALIKIAGKQRYLGLFATREEAACAYDAAALEALGDFARLNSQGKPAAAR